ncbi:hypothetical protein [Nocardia carnea]|uniref:hypothetical protein n=1 Tax=Nocardia carnea TaxID=37328 RepID=UPI00245784C9|nr:hypothetical protein [Nocardia carnea]
MTTQQFPPEVPARPPRGPERPWYSKPEFWVGVVVVPLIIALISLGAPFLLGKLVGDDAPSTVAPPTPGPSVPVSSPAVSTTMTAPDDPRWQRVYSQRSIDIEESLDACRGYTIRTIVIWDKAEPTVHTGSHQTPDFSFGRRCDGDRYPFVSGTIGVGSVLEPTPQLCFEQAGGENPGTGHPYVLREGATFCGITLHNNVLWFEVVEVDIEGGPMARIEATLWTRRA